MNALDYIKRRQQLWALRNGVELQGSQGATGWKGYTKLLEDNLFQGFSTQARKEFTLADGGELKGEPCKMQALHSSSALGVNIFEYWRRSNNLHVLAKSLKIPVSGIQSLTFEEKMPHAASSNTTHFPKSPNLDVVLRYKGNNTHIIGIECKFSEAYGRGHSGIRPSYLEHGILWSELPNLKSLAQEISPNDSLFDHLHPAQLIKHILALKHACSKYATPSKKFWLCYVYYDVPTKEGAKHREEIQRFWQIAHSDGIRFHPISYQNLIAKLFHNNVRDQHASYLDYVAERYL